MILWGHALAALLFGLLALSQIRHAADALPRLTFVLALGATALWALAVAGIGSVDLTTNLLEALRDLGWLGFMFALVRRDRRAPERAAIQIIYGVVATIVLASGMLAIATAALPASDSAVMMAARVVLQMMVAVSALLLIHHLYAAVAPGARGGIRLVVVALAAMWSVDLVLFATAYASAGWPTGLVAMRGLALALLAPIFALAVHRNGDWTLQLSRTVAYQSLSLAAIALYVIAMGMATSLLATIGGPSARIVQTAFVFGTTAALFAILSTPWLRAWTRVKLAKHLFAHRYDYRQEWLRFTDTLGKPGEDAAPLETRIVKAVADMTDSTAGLLLVRDGAGLGQGASWRWDGDSFATDGELPRYLEATGRIIALDAVRTDAASPEEARAVPSWMVDRPDAWVLLPLLHFGKLTGALLLARPPIDRAPDWEDFDLLHLAGRQVASYLAEARAQQALAEAQRFDEFNRRFAFIMHDIKNLVSQLSLVARNAERHADNPDFRADMIATLQDSAARMNALLARLSQHHQTRSEAIETVDLAALVGRVASRRTAQHPIVTGGARDAVAAADPARLEQILDHLLQNAIEASPAGEPVALVVGHEGDRVYVDVIDHGAGMSPAFVRDRLFKPFVSSKAGGFGLGAFEARQLAEAMGGSVDVASREGEGTRFRVNLPAVVVPMLGAAA